MRVDRSRRVKPGPHVFVRPELGGGQRSNVIDLGFEVPRRFPKVYCALGIQPELGAVAE